MQPREYAGTPPLPPPPKVEKPRYRRGALIADDTARIVIDAPEQPNPIGHRLRDTSKKERVKNQTRAVFSKCPRAGTFRSNGIALGPNVPVRQH
jgi:hypothetical protein